MWQTFKEWVQRLKHDTLALWFACRDRRTPWWVRLLGILIVAYALSPIDLIPDFIPVVGYLDDLILIPAGLWLLLKSIPPQTLSECRDKASAWFADGNAKPRSALGATIVIIVWIAIAGWLVSVFAASTIA